MLLLRVACIIRTNTLYVFFSFFFDRSFLPVACYYYYLQYHYYHSLSNSINIFIFVITKIIIIIENITVISIITNITNSFSNVISMAISAITVLLTSLPPLIRFPHIFTNNIIIPIFSFPPYLEHFNVSHQPRKRRRRRRNFTHKYQ